MCNSVGCRRERVPTSRTGIVHALCQEHEREALSVFGDNWADQARHGVFRSSITGGIPICHDHPLDAGGRSPVPPGSSRLAGVERVAEATTHGPMGAR